jgi:hypothetical protein
LKFYLNTSHIKLMWTLYFVTSSALTIITLREIRKLYINNNSRRNSTLTFILQRLTQLIVIIISISVTKYKLEIDGGIELFPKLFESISFIVWTTQFVTLARLIYVLLFVSLVLCQLGIIVKNQFEKGRYIFL